MNKIATNKGMKSIHRLQSMGRQRGLTALGWVCALLSFGFVIFCLSKIVPSYMDNWQIQSSLETLGELRITENEFDGANNGQIRSHLSKFFRVNGIPSDLVKEVKITRKDGRAYVDIIWERRVPLLSNIDVVMHFENQFDSLNPTDCCLYREDNR